MNLLDQLRSGGLRRRMATAGTIAALAVTGVVGSGAVTAAHAADLGVIDIVLGVGANETQRTVTWYTTEGADSTQVLQYAKASEVVGDVFPDSAVTVAATGATTNRSGYTNRRALIQNLAENTTYVYRVGSEGSWSPTHTFKSQDFEGDFEFLFLGDPQIGSSGNVPNDRAGWQATLDVALTAHPDVEMLVSGGDQVEVAGNETQWDAFFGPDQLRQVPWAATIGNHDYGAKSYENHFTTPNTDYSAQYYQGNPTTQSGGDYWYIYKDVLFINLNSNREGGTPNGNSAHIEYVTDVVNAHGDKAKYTVLTYHHAIYSPASHAQDADAQRRRAAFPTAFSELGVDLVLQGHDHAYSRSYELKNGQRADASEAAAADEVFQGPGGVVYVTANSASGSKYYNITNPGSFADPNDPSKRWYNSVENQERKRSYVKVAVKNDKLVVENIRSEASPSGEIGSVVDKVAIRPYHGEGQEIGVRVPEGDPGEFGWTIDGHNGLVDLGTAEEKVGYFQALGEINPLVVTDTRKAKAPWSVSAGVGDFVDGEKSLSGKYLGWTPKVIGAGAGAQAGAKVESGYDSGEGLLQSRVLSWAEQGHDRGNAKVGSNLDLKLPDEAAKGNYRATLTITALSS